MKDANKKLLEEINVARQEIKTDSYNMSIGEILNLYEDNEIVLNPSFQRLFRWSEQQKTKFIESLIIGIPIPSIFVAQKKDGKWDIVDGVQRISTVLQLTGKLRNKEQLTLATCKYLPSIEGLTWENLPSDTKRLIKRAKLPINIILAENSSTSQYELFQRLNTGGSLLSSQEVRNCLIIMVNEQFFESINIFKNNPDFKTLIQLSSRMVEEEYPMELILRYLIAKNNKTDYSKFKINSVHIREFIDSETIRLCKDKSFNIEYELEILAKTLKKINKELGEKAFVDNDNRRTTSRSRFSLRVYQLLLPGLASHLDKAKSLDGSELNKIINTLQKEPEYDEIIKTGTRSMVSYKTLTELSHSYFKDLEAK